MAGHLIDGSSEPDNRDWVFYVHQCTAVACATHQMAIANLVAFDCTRTGISLFFQRWHIIAMAMAD